MNDIVVRKQSEGDEAEPEGKKKKGDELREGNSLGVPKSNVSVGKLKQREREWLKDRKNEQEKQKGSVNRQILRLDILYC